MAVHVVWSGHQVVFILEFKTRLAQLSCVVWGATLQRGRWNSPDVVWSGATAPAGLGLFFKGA